MIFDSAANTIQFGDVLPESGNFGEIFLNMAEACLYTFNGKWVRLNNDARYDLHLFFGELPKDKNNSLFFMKCSREFSIPDKCIGSVAFAEFFDGAFELSMQKNNIEFGTIIFSQNDGIFKVASETFKIGDEFKIYIKATQKNKQPPKNISITLQAS